MLNNLYFVLRFCPSWFQWFRFKHWEMYPNTPSSQSKIPFEPLCICYASFALFDSITSPTGTANHHSPPQSYHLLKTYHAVKCNLETNLAFLFLLLFSWLTTEPRVAWNAWHNSGTSVICRQESSNLISFVFWILSNFRSDPENEMFSQFYRHILQFRGIKISPRFVCLQSPFSFSCVLSVFKAICVVFVIS